MPTAPIKRAHVRVASSSPSEPFAGTANNDAHGGSAAARAPDAAEVGAAASPPHARATRWEATSLFLGPSAAPSADLEHSSTKGSRRGSQHDLVSSTEPAATGQCATPGGGSPISPATSASSAVVRAHGRRSPFSSEVYLEFEPCAGEMEIGASPARHARAAEPGGLSEHERSCERQQSLVHSVLSVDFFESFDVGVHVYDLSKGLAKIHSHALVGHGNLQGVFHSAVVVYGFEYFFEGGVARAPKGATRFGESFTYHYVGATSLPQHKFEMWLREQVPQRFSLCHYKTIEHNCHHFCHAACMWLCNARAPAFLLENTHEVASSAIGKAVVPLFTRINGGMQFHIAQQLKQHRMQRNGVARRKIMARDHAGVTAVPPCFLFSFATSGEMVCEALQWLHRAHDPIECDFKVTPAEVAALNRVADTCAFNHALALNPEVHRAARKHIDEFDLSMLITIMTRTCEHREDWIIARVLRAWSVLSLDPQFVGVVVFNKRLNVSLMRLAFAFHRLSPSAQICLLRVLCNYGTCAYGSAFLLDHRRVDHFLSVLGNALTSQTQPVRLHAASLLANLVFGLPVVTRGSLDLQIDTRQLASVPMRLYVLAHFHAHAANDDGTLHRVLLALQHLLAHGGSLARAVDALNLPYDVEGILKQCRSVETRALAVEVGFLLEVGDEKGPQPR